MCTEVELNNNKEQDHNSSDQMKDSDRRFWSFIDLLFELKLTNFCGTGDEPAHHLPPPPVHGGQGHPHHLRDSSGQQMF